MTRVLPLGLLAAILAAAPGHARTVPTGGSVRVAKPERAPVSLYWVSPLDDRRVQIWPHPGHVIVGKRYDLIDEKGWLGQVDVVSIERQDSGCNTQLEVATARAVGAPGRPAEGSIFAVGPTNEPFLRGRVTYPESEHGLPPAGDEGLVAIDLDGDRTLELARSVIYDCELVDGATRKRYTGHTCFLNWVRTGSKWKVLESMELGSCY